MQILISSESPKSLQESLTRGFEEKHQRMAQKKAEGENLTVKESQTDPGQSPETRQKIRDKGF